MNNQNYILTNKQAWNERSSVHIESNFYNQAAFLQGQNSLKEIELDLLGDINHQHILHLQCHFGQDTLSLARMGAKVTGIDLSDVAISFAKKTAEQLHLDASFICCDLYDLPNHLHQTFDTVFTTYGTIGWLPDINQWASIVAQFLKPGGEFIFVEFHPFVWMMDNDLRQISYNYFKDEAIVEEEAGTYANKDASIKPVTIGWNHGLAEVIQALLNEQLELVSFEEFDYSPYDIFPNSIEVGPSRYRVQHLGNKVPLTYALKMKKKI